MGAEAVPVTAIETRVGLEVSVTVKPGEVTLLSAAVMEVAPAATPVINPVAFTVAWLVVPETQVAELVRFAVLASEYVPVAVN
jgi:hypothetical protein